MFPLPTSDMLKNKLEQNNAQKMYDAVQELVCAFIVNQEEVERARQNKKSMLKVYQARDKDLEYAFMDCINTCEKLLNIGI